ncbi:MAG: hypothetical protein JXQ97_07670 [Natronospirillum sp.]
MDTQRWFDALAQCKANGDPFVLATILSAAGSTPRDQDAKMVITAQAQYDTVGGGHLEYKVIQRARTALTASAWGFRIERYALGSQLGQCCGGAVSLLLECFPASELHTHSTDKQTGERHAKATPSRQTAISGTL